MALILITAVLYSAPSRKSTQEHSQPNPGQTMWSYCNGCRCFHGKCKQVAELVLFDHIRNNQSSVASVICGFSHLWLYVMCSKCIYLCVNHDYEAYENEVLRLLFTLKSVFLLFHVIQNTIFI